MVSVWSNWYHDLLSIQIEFESLLCLKSVFGHNLLFRRKVLLLSVRDTRRPTRSAEDAIVVPSTFRRVVAALAVILMPRWDIVGCWCWVWRCLNGVVTFCRQLGFEEFSPSWTGNWTHALPQDYDSPFQERIPWGFRGSCSLNENDYR